MSQSIFSADALIYWALVFYVFGFLFRDELWLRLLLLAGTICYVAYYFSAPATPLWDAIYTNSLVGLANFFMILITLSERSKFTMSTEMSLLYSHFPNLSPGQFKKVMRKGHLVRAEDPVRLSEQDMPQDKLYYIFDGTLKLEKNRQQADLDAGCFIGELVFLRGGNASATVWAGSDTTYIVWDYETLRELLRRTPNLSNAMIARFNLDMARKLAGSHPVRL